MLKNVIWDLDGTLYDTYPGILTALIATLAKFGVSAERAALFTTIKHSSVRGELARIGKTIGVPYDTLWADYHDREVSGFVMQAQAYPDTARVLRGVVAAGGQNFLMTHRDDSAWALLRRDGLADLFKGGVTSAQHLARKPAPDAVLYILDTFGLQPASTAMIGDRQLDVVAGQAAGVAGIYFDIDGYHDAPMADATIQTLPAVLDLLA